MKLFKRKPIYKYRKSSHALELTLQELCEESTDQFWLEKIAKEHKISSFRAAACSLILDQLFLEKIVYNEDVLWVKDTAAEKITDPNILERIVLEYDWAPTRKIVLDKIVDQKLIAKLAQFDSCTSIRLQSVAKLNDINILEKIAIEDVDPHTRREALRLITNQAVLINILNKEESYWVRAAAIKNIKDESVLQQVAFNDKDYQVRVNALKVLNNQELIDSIATTNKSNYVRGYVVPLLNDLEILEKISKENIDYMVREKVENRIIELKQEKAKNPLDDTDEFVRFDAIDGIIDEKLLFDVVMNEEFWSIREKAFEKLLNVDLITKIALEHKDPYTSQLAVKKLIDDEVLAKIAMNDKNWFVRRSAAWKLKDKELLLNITHKYESTLTRKALVWKCTDQIEIKKIAIKDNNADVRRVAIWKLADLKLLESISHNDKDEYVRKTAEWRVEQLTKKKIRNKKVEKLHNVENNDVEIEGQITNLQHIEDYYKGRKLLISVFNQDGSKIICCDDYCRLTIWGVETGELLHSFQLSEKYFSSFMNISNNREKIVLLVDYGTFKYEILFWDIEKNSSKLINKTIFNGITSACFSPDDKLVAFRMRDNSVLLWNIETEKEVYTYGDLRSFSMVPLNTFFTPDSMILAIITSPPRTTFIDTLSDRIFWLKTLEENGEEYCIEAINISPNGQTFAYLEEDRLHIFNIFTSQRIDFFSCSEWKYRESIGAPHNRNNGVIAFGENGKLMASGHLVLQVRDLETKDVICKFTNDNWRTSYKNVAFHPSEKMIIARIDNMVKLLHINGEISKKQDLKK